MATYTVTGHPLNPSALDIAAADLAVLRTVLPTLGVGQTFTMTLAGPDDTKVKGHGALK